LARIPIPVGGSVPAVFDAFLYRAIGGFQQLRLTVKLRINLWRLASRVRDIAKRSNLRAL
jgi:hypothetical protein